MKNGVSANAWVLAYYGTYYYTDIFDHDWGSDFCVWFDEEAINKHIYHECRNHHGIDDKSEGDLPKR